MAKRKKRRPGSPVRPGGPGRGPTRVTTAGNDSSPPAVKPAPGGVGGPNRVARKEEARRQREAIRKQAARRRLIRRGTRIGAVLGVAGGIAFLIWLLSRPAGLSDEEQRLLDQAPQAAAAAGCEDVRTVEQYADGRDQEHAAELPPLSSYPSRPPTSGPHNGSGTVRAGVYTAPQPIGDLLHSLEHGAMVVWYDRETVDTQALTELQTFFRDGHQDHVIIAPYEYPDEGEAGRLPEGKTMALAAWHRLQTCDSMSLPVAWAFARSFAAADFAAYQGEAPEVGANGIGAPI